MKMPESPEGAILLERLADLEHKQWALWTEYMLKNLDDVHITGWRRQIATAYQDLTEREKDEDREWAEKVMGIVRELGWKEPEAEGV